MRTEGPKSTSSTWFEEGILEESLTIRMRLKKMVVEKQSEFQHIQVIETAPFGKTLVLDGKTQSTAFDERIYHETLVHPAMLLCDAKSVYIGGGGELATARECLRHPGVEKVVMCDLDGDVVDVCKEYLPEWNGGSTEDPRFELHIGDARAFLVDSPAAYDLVVLDIADPIEAGPAVHLYTKDFYDIVKQKLNPGGVVVTQSGPAGVFNFDECFTAIHKTLEASFGEGKVAAYSTSIPSFGSEWGFNVAVRDGPLRFPSDIDAALSTIKGGPLAHYDAQTHRRMFALPKILRNGLRHEARIITAANPVFMF
ncbi:hypothetical protein CTAYLR_002603 [Chrysophaeum taylorii]|uniref:thermospermine synthase n=1 Tax=Chrysophaeum taylorii TaxID=2483200 RepID=A0AAD7XLH2_9STRA|nr:hypothetical protein CTAYLR_002603 [Chrysophaeum taylorii]